MADVPTNIITVNFPEDGEGGGGNVDMRAHLEALNKLQDSVSRISVTLRSILELLRGMGTRGRNAAVAGGSSEGSGGGGGATAALRAARIAERREIREARLAVRGIAARFGMTGRVGLTASQSDVYTRFQDPAQRAGMGASEFALGSGIQGVQQRAAQGQAAAARAATATTQRDAARAARQQAQEAQRLARAQVREGERLARAQAREAQRLARLNRPQTGGLSPAIQARLFELQQRARTPGMALGLTDEENALVTGNASPVGVAGRRRAAGIMSAHRAHARRVAAANRPPPIRPVGAGPGGGGGDEEGPIGSALTAFSAVLGPIGRVLAVGRMLLGAVQSIGQMIGAILAYSKEQRHSFGMVDPVIAKQNATVMIAGLMDRMAMAQNPLIRSSSGVAAQAELIRMGGTQNVRGAMTLAANYFSASWDRSIGYLGMGLEGDARGIFLGVSENPLSSFLGAFGSVGLALQGISALLGLIFGAEWKADLDAKALARVRSSTGIFVGDLHVMTGGRFSLSAAYPTQPGRMTSRGRVPGMVGNAGNWWNVPGTI
jgi:hypothetical protein